MVEVVAQLASSSDDWSYNTDQRNSMYSALLPPNEACAHPLLAVSTQK